jgi:hypothetical protein
MLKNLLRHLIPERFRPSVLADRLVSTLLTTPKVAGGLFEGLKYVHQSQGSEHLPKLLGCYELELQPLFRELGDYTWRRIVDVGGGEGYYAVGIAYLWPDVMVHVFESSEIGRLLIAEMAEMNAVADKIEIAGFCGTEELRAAVGDGEKTLLIMDIEGAENELLAPSDIPPLLNCTIVVEVHEYILPGLLSTLMGRFKSSSHFQVIPTRHRRVGELPYPGNPVLRLWMGKNLLSRTGEARPGPMCWLIIRPDPAARQ